LTGEEGNISNLCQFEWYEWCYYWEHKEGFPYNWEVLGRVRGQARGEGNEMAQWILKANGNIIPRRTARPLQVAKKHSPMVHKQQEVFDGLIERRHGTSINPPKTRAAILTSPIRKIGIITRMTTKYQTSYLILKMLLTCTASLSFNSRQLMIS
jgi:hypothetical protein